jgi:predicted amino acid racemase
VSAIDMITPRIEINLRKIAHNAKTLKELYGSKGIDVIGVTKVVCGDPAISKTLVEAGINLLADSRIANIRKMRDEHIQAQFLLLRSIRSQAKDIVKYADIAMYFSKRNTGVEYAMFDKSMLKRESDI